MRIVRFFCLVTAMAVVLSVSVFAAPPEIIQQPTDFYFPSNVELPATCSFSILASGENLTYQWQNSIDGSPWTNSNAAGNQTASLSVSMSSQRVNGRQQFRCIVSNSEGQVVSEVVSTSVAAYIIDSIPQMLHSAQSIIDNIFSWVGMAAVKIIDIPLLLIGVSFFALGSAIAILSRLLSRS